MQYKIGSFTLDTTTTKRAAVERSVVRTARGYRGYGLLKHSLRVRLRAANQTALDAKIEDFENATASDGFAFGYILNSGANATFPHYCAVNKTVGGGYFTKAPSFGEVGQAQYGTFIDLSLEIEAKLDDAETDEVISFQEILKFGGETRDVIWHRPLDGVTPAIKNLGALPIYTAAQSGTIVGYDATITPPDPLWPDDLVGQPMEAGPFVTHRGSVVEYSLRYEYRFERNTPFDTATTPEVL